MQVTLMLQVPGTGRESWPVILPIAVLKPCLWTTSMGTKQFALVVALWLWALFILIG